MKVNSSDKLIMLLSTDWFQPYWYKLGIGVDADQKILLRDGCREIVREIMSDASEFWHVDFSDERKQRTHSMLTHLLHRCRVSEFATAKINSLTKSGGSATADEATSWLVLSITEQLLQGSLLAAPPPPSEIKEAIRRAWLIDAGEVMQQADFEGLCLSSRTDWDEFVRKTTPDLPTLLADYACGLLTTDRFELFWAALTAVVSVAQRAKVISWYCQAGESLTGEELRLT